MKAAAAILALAAAALPAFGAAAGDVTLRIEGDDAARFMLECDGFTHEGAPPFERRFPGPLTCAITQTAAHGSIQVHVASERGNVSRFATEGAGSTLRFRVE